MEKTSSARRVVVSFWRPTLIGVLLLLPVVVMIVAGTWALWLSPTWRWILWLTPLCWGAGYLLLRRWNRRLLPAWEHDWKSTPHWTPRDEAAMRIVQEYQQRAGEILPGQLEDPHFYLQSSIELALRIAKHYYPKTKDPLGALTAPEILAAAQLALEDSEEWLRTYVPGSTLLTVNQWRALARAPRWVKLATDAGWALSLLFNPAALGRYVASRVTMDSASKQIQANVLEAFYRVFIHSVGQYLIEMNSGRLRGGARRYRAALAQLRHETLPPTEAPRAPSTPAPRGPLDVVTIALVGQAGAGKTSVLEALAATAAGITARPADELNDQVTHEWTLDNRVQQVRFLDTPGYDAAQVTSQQQDRINEAAQRADLLLVVMNATSPARQHDLQIVKRTLAWFQAQPRFKPPALLGVLTHIDGLSPLMEWEPPYNWQDPVRPKEKNIRAAVDYAHEVFGDTLQGVVPVCSAQSAGRVYGIEQHLIPSMIALLGEARANALLRTLHAEIDDGRVRTVLRQLRNVGTGLLDAYLRR